MQHDGMRRAMSTMESAYRSYQEAVKTLTGVVAQRKEQTKCCALPLDPAPAFMAICKMQHC